ncbi:MAG: hypothetical protein JNK64_18115 [Myxococcales bacterium]|nr:hypothetical protein [Myxococcales bacterium]
MARRLAFLVLAACGGSAAAPPPPTLPRPREVVRPMPPAPPVAPALLSSDVLPIAYRLDVTVDPAATDYQGSVDIDVTIGAATRTVWLAAGADLRVTSASVTTRAGDAVGTVVRASDAPDLVGVTLPTPVAGAATLHLAFAAAFRDRDGLFVQDAGGARVAYTDFEPSEARHAFPCFDEPRWRAPVTTTLRTPERVAAFANAPLVSATREGDGVVHRFAPTPPLPTYLIAFAVGDFVAVDVPDAPVPTRVIAPAALARVDHARALVGPLLAAATAWIDRPFPYPKLDLIVVPDMNGAMENPGLITIAADIAVAPSDAEGRALLALVIAHELAHAWFGGWVTPADWRDLWLNEGLATWMSDRILRALPTPTRVDAEHVADRLTIAAGDRADGRALRPRVLVGRRQVFDQLTYQKGAAVMHMLAAWLGDGAVRGALRAYLDGRPWGVATTDAMIDALAAIDPDAPIAQVARAAIEEPGVPAVRVERVCNAGRALVRLSPIGPPRATPVCVRWGGAQAGRGCAVVDAVVAVEAGASCPPWAVPDGEAYLRWEVAPGDWAAIAAAPLSAAERVDALAAILDAVTADRASGADAAAMLAAAIASGDPIALGAAAPWVPVVLGSADARRRPALTRMVRAATDRALTTLGRAPTPREADHRAAARAIALELAGNYGDDRATVRWARRTFAAWQRGAALAPTVLAPALAIVGHRATAGQRRALIAAATSDVERSRAQTRALGRALAELPAADVTPLIDAVDSPVPMAIRAEAVGALLERPDRAAATVAALPAAFAALTLFATPTPCAVAALDRSFSDQLEARAAAAVARCQAVARATAR